MIDLKKQYGTKYKIQLDESADILNQEKSERLWYYRIPCKYGHIGVWGKKTLSYYCDRPRFITKLIGLVEINGWEIVQRGESEIQFTFRTSQFYEVADVVKPKKKRQLTEAHLARLLKSSAGNRFAGRSDGTNGTLSAPGTHDEG